MSAWMHDHDHIDLILSAAMKTGKYNRPYIMVEDSRRALGYLDSPESVSVTTLGRMMLAENSASVRHSYGSVDDTVEGVENDLVASTYTFREVHPEAYFGSDWWVNAIHAVESLQYQSCEHPRWESSEAARWCQAIVDALVRDMPGRVQGSWRFSRNWVPAIAVGATP